MIVLHGCPLHAITARLAAGRHQHDNTELLLLSCYDEAAGG